jgi:uncharacterized protein YukE
MTKTEKQVAKVQKVRKDSVRKQLTADIRALERIRKSLEKAAVTIAENGENLKGDTHNQIADLLGKLNIGVTVVETTISDKANAIARTFIK